MTMKLPMMIAVRGYAVPVHVTGDKGGNERKKSKRKRRKTLKTPSEYSLVFDTETTADHTQNLRIGSYQVHKGMVLIERGLLYEPDALTPAEIDPMKSYSRMNGLVLHTREEFVRQVFYKYGYDYGGLIIGFNLPFDLSRLATGIATSCGWDMRGGFSLELLPVKWRCHPIVKHLNSRAAFMRFAAPPKQIDGRSMRKKGFETQAKSGFFQDVKTAAAALLGGSRSLASLAEELGTPHQKKDSGGHGGPLTPEYIGYAVNDVDVTWDCYVELLKRYGEHGLTETPMHRIYSEASLGKAYLRQMGIETWSELQPDFPPEVLGIIMSTYYGGRAEVRIRRQMTRVLYCDFRSMYPTVCTLMGLWRFVTATGIQWQDWTRNAQDCLERVNLAELQNQDTWKDLTILVQVQPDEDIFPVRARYDEGSRTIGLNYLSADLGLWYTLADCLASKLLTGRTPRIVKALRFTPGAPQTGLKPIMLGGNGDFRIDPNADDFYKRVIELRGEIQSLETKAKAEGDLREALWLNSYQQMLKLLANSTSYGIFAELNVQSYDRPKSVVCYGAEDQEFATGTKSVEEAGTHFHPLLATLITGAARLMLALAERVASDRGIGWALCDTDSLALARPTDMGDATFLKKGLAVTEWFNPLSPYDDDKPLFKVEDQNFRLKDGVINKNVHEPLYAIAISAKRYVLFNLDNQGRPIIRKALAHGLGHLLAPYDEKEAPAAIPAPTLKYSDIGKFLKATDMGVERWQYDFWRQIIMAELEGHPDRVDLSILPNLHLPATSRYSAASAPLLHWFDKFNQGKPWREQVKAFNFLLAFQVSKPQFYTAIANGTVDASYLDDELPTAIAPYDDDYERGATKCFDRLTGKPVPIALLTTYRGALAGYHLHSESKFENGDIFDRSLTKRRHIQAVAIEYIGKEANRWEDQFFLGEMPEAQIEYGVSPAGKWQLLKLITRAARKFGQTTLANAARLSRKQLSLLIGGHVEPRSATIRLLLRAIMALEIERQAEARSMAQFITFHHNL